MGPKQALRAYFKVHRNTAKLLMGLILEWSRRPDLNR